ncbi:hypothetical protein CY34DRAFT_807036 [Suillus luteus UH-Slu-Lm8-n1]|uniref:Unplaced genomic scaffold CY34scaffold_165, whole genome shotgun sequence n=1 Tax=Suillus luteus UH-Slu-Lm8-n1 TaxID=930992 RepID=A0A0C9ZS51_9AGAM|nr:hypothetical protein CY34DRAFT_807036 [Suillus luteus UH-Slu-Lm8-n1]
MNSTISIYPHLAFPSPPPYVFPQEQPTFIKSRLSESPATSDTSSVEHPARDNSHRASRFTIAHPYARLYAKKDGSKRRKIWNHVLEKQLFSPQELSTMGAPHRRTIYIASLEAHIDRLHNQLLGIGLYPIPFQRLEPYRGLNSKTAKSMVAGLQHDATHTKLKLLELERSNNNLHKLLGTQAISTSSISLEADVRRHSMDSAVNSRTAINSGVPIIMDSLAYSARS